MLSHMVWKLLKAFLMDTWHQDRQSPLLSSLHLPSSLEVSLLLCEPWSPMVYKGFLCCPRPLLLFHIHSSLIGEEIRDWVWRSPVTCQEELGESIDQLLASWIDVDKLPAKWAS